MDPTREKTLNELSALDARIASVRREQARHSIVGPAAMTGAGYGFGAVFAIAALVEWAIAEDIRQGDCGYYYRDRFDDYYEYDSRCDVNDDGEVDADDRRLARNLARTFGALSLAGTAVGIGGTVWLVKRLSKRRAYHPELRELGVRRGQLLQQLRYGGGYSHNGIQLTVSARF